MSTVNQQSRPFSWNSYGISDSGKEREHNEDAMLIRPDMGIWAVADGMGGHTAGDFASQSIVKRIGEAVNEKPEKLSLNYLVDKIEDSLVEVNSILIKKAQENQKAEDSPITIGSTVVILITYDKYCLYIWSGDSRAYRYRNNQLRQITVDHSQVEEYVERGLITREEAQHHPMSNIITHAIGVEKDPYLDMDMQELQHGDRYLLCSDGLTKHIEELELQDLLKNEGKLYDTTEKTCKNLINITLDRGAKDNVTAIIIDIQ